jgi:glycine/D-amino acid oxidase-like deaminating enzyme
MQVAVLGGGLQGCCTALALAESGVRVTLFDRNEQLLSRAAVANEGKIHLGYMYAGDPSLSTARTMMRGALAFAPFFARHLGKPSDGFAVSAPAVYLVHRDSQHGPEEVEAYLGSVHRLVSEAAEGRPRAYFGIEFPAKLRAWNEAERGAEFNPAIALAAFSTPEVAIDPVELARAIRNRVAAEPRIEVRLRHAVRSVSKDGERLCVSSEAREGGDGADRDRYDHVVNALWDGRLAVDHSFGLTTDRPWLHRLKYGVSFRNPARTASRSVTVISGPFGEVVEHGGGLTYLTWYPECLRGISRQTTPPEWDTYPAEPLRSRLIGGTLSALAEIVPALGALNGEHLPELCVKGGVIVAWGQTDIYDPDSELHRRFAIGITSVGRFHSIDPGKLTMAPYFAEMCAARIVGAA